MWSGRWSRAGTGKWRISKSSQNSVAKSSRRVSHHSSLNNSSYVSIRIKKEKIAETNEEKELLKWTFSIFAWQCATIPRWSRNNFLFIIFFHFARTMHHFYVTHYIFLGLMVRNLCSRYVVLLSHALDFKLMRFLFCSRAIHCCSKSMMTRPSWLHGSVSWIFLGNFYCLRHIQAAGPCTWDGLMMTTTSLFAIFLGVNTQHTQQKTKTCCPRAVALLTISVQYSPSVRMLHAAP